MSVQTKSPGTAGSHSTRLAISAALVGAGLLTFAWQALLYSPPGSLLHFHNWAALLALLGSTLYVAKFAGRWREKYEGQIPARGKESLLKGAAKIFAGIAILAISMTWFMSRIGIAEMISVAPVLPLATAVNFVSAAYAHNRLVQD